MKKHTIILCLIFSLFLIPEVKAYVGKDYLFTDSGATEWTHNDVTFSKKDIENAFVSEMGEIPENYFCVKMKGYSNVVCPYDYDETHYKTNIYIGSKSCTDSNKTTCTNYLPEKTYAHFSLINVKYLSYIVSSGDYELKSSTSSTTPFGLTIYNFGYAPSTNYEMLYSTYDIYTNFNGSNAHNENKEHLIFKSLTSSLGKPIYAEDGYGKYIKIPTSFFYQDGQWGKYLLYFRSRTVSDFGYAFQIVYENDESDLPEIPLKMFINEQILDINDYINNIVNSSYTDGNGFGGGFSISAGNFGGGGGGGSFDDTDDLSGSCSSIDNIIYSSKLPSNDNYGALILSSSNCTNLVNKTPDDFKTKYIKIYYNARLYEENDEVIDDWYDNAYDDLNDDSPLSSYVQPFISLINSKFPIFGQLKNIYNELQFNENTDEPPVFEIDATSLGYGKLKVIDFSFFNQYRDFVFMWIKLGCACISLVKISRILSDYFGGGN